VKRAWRFIALGIVVYLSVLLVSFPVERLTGTISSQVEGLSFQAVTGSLFSGRAASLVYQGNEIGPVRWRFSPGGLLRARLEYRVESENPLHAGQGLLGIGPGGTLVGQDVDLQILPDPLINTFAPLAISSTGQLHLVLDRFVLREGQAQDVTGRMEWLAAELLAPVQLPLGDIRCDIESEPGGVVARITEGGTLGASGDVTLTEDGRYSVRLLLDPGPEAGADLRSLLEAMLRPRADGRFPITLTGRL
jgi:hypothetical protein